MISLFASILLLFSSAFANDSMGTIQSQGVVFEKSKDIVMLSEDLVISPKTIEVTYEFRNESPKDIEGTVTFPLPGIYIDFPYGIPLVDKQGKVLPDPFHFELEVDGKRKDVSMKAVEEPNSPETTITYFWKQVFPAQKTILVKHKYLAAAGNPGEGLAPYCPDNAFYTAAQKVVNQLRVFIADDDGKTPYPLNVRDPKFEARAFRWTTKTALELKYILKTGANWKGPIKKFKLTILKEPEQMISLCMDGIKKAGTHRFVVEKTDFTPTQDLNILFVGTHPLKWGP